MFSSIIRKYTKHGIVVHAPSKKRTILFYIPLKHYWAQLSSTKYLQRAELQFSMEMCNNVRSFLIFILPECLPRFLDCSSRTLHYLQR